jgi:glutaredoxin 3
MPKVEMYTTAICPYCIRARQLLDTKGVEYREIRVERDRAQWRHMAKRSKRNTVPQIFVNDLHIGGYDDMVELDAFGQLDPLLGLENGSRV